MSRWLGIGVLVLVGCNGGSICGSGTVSVDGVCVVVSADAGDAASPMRDGGAQADAARDLHDAGTTSPDAGSMDAGATDAARAADVGTDAWLADSGPFVLRDGDSLLMHPTSANLVPGFAVCPELTVLHADGSTTAVLPGAATVTTTPFDTTIAGVADPADCAALPGYSPSTGAGILSLTPGTTTAQFTVSSMGRSVSATLAIHVADGTVSVDAPESVVVPVGGSANEPLIITARLASGGSADVSAYARLVSHLFAGLSGMPDGIINVGPGPNYYTLQVTGVAVGMAQIHATYGVPGYTTDFTSSQMVRVVAPGTLTAVARVDYYALDGSFRSQGRPSSMAPGDCLDMRSLGQFTSPGGTSYSQPLTSGVTYTVTGPGHVDGAELCATAHGELTLQACDAGLCATDHIPVLTLSLVSSFTISPSDAMLTFAFGGFTGCAPLQAVIAYTDGTTQDVTNSYATYWATTAPGSVSVYRPPLGGTAPPMVDASGNPCFASMGTVAAHSNLGVVASYGGIQTNVVMFHW